MSGIMLAASAVQAQGTPLYSITVSNGSLITNVAAASGQLPSNFSLPVTTNGPDDSTSCIYEMTKNAGSSSKLTLEEVLGAAVGFSPAYRCLYQNLSVGETAKAVWTIAAQMPGYVPDSGELTITVKRAS